MNSFATTYPKDRPRGRCCALCWTPFNCGNPECGCHPWTIERLIARAAKSNEHPTHGTQDRERVAKYGHALPNDRRDES